MKNKHNYYVAMLITFFLGIASTLLLMREVTLASSRVIEENVTTVNVTEADSLKSAIGKVYDSVVYIENTTSSGSGSGSGFVYKTDDKYGYILTNYHVIENYKKIVVTNSEMQEYDAVVLGYEASTDLAVVRIPKEGVLLVAELGDNNTMSIGDTVFAVGSPQGIEYINSVTRGIISGSERLVPVTIGNMEYMMDVIQTDTAINPGNSGGPLVSSTGKVIGINSMKLVENKIEGMGFAIPIEIALSYVERLEKGEVISRPYLGIETLNVAAYNNNRFYYQRQYGLFDIDEEMDEGVLVASVEAGSVAEKAGLKAGDVIYMMDGNKTDDMTHFRYLLYKYEVGDTVTIKFYRAGASKEVKIVLSDSRKD